MTFARRPQLLGVLHLCTAAAALSACGGGGSSDTAAPGPVAPATVRLTGAVVDGPLQGAVACFDLNDNNACDAGEPVAAATDADGKFALDVAAADAGKHRIVVQVPATAVDKDTGAAVGAAFTLLAPASNGAGAQAVFVSPLTTLVQRQADANAVPVADAADFIKAQAGLAVSPLADFTAASNDDNTKARAVARLAQKTFMAQTAAVAGTVGTTDISGATISASDLEALVAKAVIGALPTVAALVADPAVAAGTPAALSAATATALAAIGLPATAVAGAVGVAKLPGEASTTASTATASATLSALRYTDADNWFYRTLESSAADNTPDADGKLRYYSVYKQSESSNFSSAGTVTAWGSGGSAARSGDLHWTGSAWAACPLFTRNLNTARDAAGRSSYDYCAGLESGTTRRAAVDIAGRSIATVFTDTIRRFPGGANGVNFADWGPSDASRFGAATFPAGAKLFYQTQTPLSTAFAYDVQASNVVTAYSAEIAAGGDTRATAGLACAASNVTATAVGTLEALVARNPGKPCVFAQSSLSNGTDKSLDPNEWWSNSTASLGVVAGAVTLPAGTGNWYSTDQRLRVAFAATGNGTTYYGCLSRASTGSSRNCAQIGTGTYAIQTLGDARVMTFTGLPAAVQRAGFARVFVERGGSVYYGYKNPVGVASDTLRLNLEATNAVFAALGIGPVRPVTRSADLKTADAAAMTAVQGAWGSATATSALVFRFADGGRFMMAEADVAKPATREQTGTEVGFYSLDTTSQTLSTLLETDSNLTAGTSHPTAGSTVTFAADRITGSDGTNLTRLADSGTGIVGLWALGSATDLKVIHVAFFGNGRVLLVDPKGETDAGACLSARQGPPGAEFASYTFDATTQALRVFGKIYDTDGCGGFFDSSTGAVAAGTANAEETSRFVIAADGKTAVLTGNDGPFTLYRVSGR